MPSGRPRQFNGPFIGLSLETSPYQETPDKAIIADNVYVKSGSVLPRLGRKELSEDQLDPGTPLGIANYTPPSQSVRSIVIVTSKGIYQRAL